MEHRPVWFSCFADVPGLGYRSQFVSTCGRLPGHAIRPRVSASTDGAVPTHTLLWPTDAGETTRSPAQTWTTQPRPGESATQTALRQLVEALELPGTLSDYHFRLLECCNTLWRSRLEEPELLEDLERACLIDLRLIELYPDRIAAILPGQLTLHVVTCGRLITLYEREGLLREALVIAERGQRLNQHTMTRAVERLQARVAQLEAEAGAEETIEIDKSGDPTRDAEEVRPCASSLASTAGRGSHAC